MMYECQSCGNRFHEPRQHKEYSEAWGRPVYEWVYGSPCCDAGYIEINEEDNEDEEDW